MHSRGEWKSFAGRTGQTFKMKMIENIDFSMDIFTCYTYCQYMKKFNANVILDKNYKSVICCKCRYERNMHTHLFTQFKSPQVRTPENIGQLIKIRREDYFGACWLRCVVRGGTPLEVARSVRLARGRDYLDVTRSGFLVRGGRRHSLSLW